MRTLCFINFLTVFYILKQHTQSGNSQEIMDSHSISSAITIFSAKFCDELDKTKNVVSSPLSAEFVLGLLTLGTSDPAHAELLTSLGIPDDDSIRSSFSEISLNLKSLKGVTFNIANKVYIAEGDYDLHPTLKEDAIKVFDAGLEKADFTKSAEAVALINKWVEDKTNNKIKDLLSSSNVDTDTRLVFVNALYFKGTWKKQFDPKKTHNQPFFINANSTVEVPMMYLESEFRYGESQELRAQLLELDYVGEQTKMLVVLPNDHEGVDGILKKLATGFDLMNEVKNMFSTKVQVSIPKFKIETEIDLKELLPKLGIRAIFDAVNSGLTRVLNKPEPLFVSHAVQKAFIEVNEEGAEAAAATGMVLMMRCARPPPLAFRADRPFLYLLMDSERRPLFIGAYRIPE